MIRIVDIPIDIDSLLSHVRTPAAGAVDLFIGTTRNHSGGRKVENLEYEVYEPMATRQMENILREVRNQWTVKKIAIIHRIGRVPVGEASIAIAVSSAHRHEAFSACRYIIDRIKETVPIWKREYFADGTAEWSRGNCMHAVRSENTISQNAQ